MCNGILAFCVAFTTKNFVSSVSTTESATPRKHRRFPLNPQRESDCRCR